MVGIHFIMLLLINQLPFAKNLLVRILDHYGLNQVMVVVANP